MFCEEGFAATSMSTIAARMGGSKGTLYNYFENKDELFEAVVRSRCEEFWRTVFSFVGEDLPVRDLLARVGEAFLRQHDERVVRLLRVVIAEAQRAPHLAQVFYETGPEAKTRKLAGYLEAAKARGELDAPDCLVAARQFMALCRGGLYLERLLNVTGPGQDDRARAEVAGAVELFMTAYAPGHGGTAV